MILPIVCLRVFLFINLSHIPDQPPLFHNDVGVTDADSLVAYAKTFIGVPYKWSGNTSEGFDCSGFVSFVYAHYNIRLPRSSADYYSIGIPVSTDSCRKGDIILFSGTDNNLSKVGHVGIIISNPGETLYFIHSSSSKKTWGVIISEFKGTRYVDRFIGIRRLPCFSLSFPPD
jgi:cell wall-associated NlpC family hydrolase